MQRGWELNQNYAVVAIILGTGLFGADNFAAATFGPTAKKSFEIGKRFKDFKKGDNFFWLKLIM